MRIFKLFFSLWLALYCLTDLYAATLKTDVDSVIKKAIQQKRIVGTVVLVYQNGKEVYRGVYGWNDREHKVPMTYDTSFRLSSLTKPIVSVAVLRLIDEEKLNLDDPVTRWLPDFKPKMPDGTAPMITIWNLLSHTAGLNYNFFEEPNGPYHRLHVSDGLDNVNFSLAENVMRISQAPLLFEPGSNWNYSLATDVLGDVISKVESEPLPEVVEQTVLKPLGLKQTGFTIEKNKPIATPYADHKPEPIRMIDGQSIPFGKSAIVYAPSRVFDKKAYPSGGAGMVSTAGDYMKFLESIRTGTIPLKKDTLIKLTTNQIGNLKTLLGDGWGWSLAFAILENPTAAKMPLGKGSYSWGGVWGHTWWVDPVNNMTVVIMTNTALEGTNGKFPHEIMHAIYQHQKKTNAE